MTHLTVVFKNKEIVSEEIGAVIALSILLNFYILWIIFDLIIMANTMRYVFSPQVSRMKCYISSMSQIMNWLIGLSAEYYFTLCTFLSIIDKQFMTLNFMPQIKSFNPKSLQLPCTMAYKPK